MKHRGVALVTILGALAALILLLAFSSVTSAPAAWYGAWPASTPAPSPATWTQGLTLRGGGRPALLSCLDRNGDSRLDAADGDAFARLDIPLIAGKACLDPANHADFYQGVPSDVATFNCRAPQPPLLVVAIGSAGTDLLDAASGESPGLLDIVNLLQSRASDAGIATEPVLSAAALFGADMPQTRMEQWIERVLGARLDAMPCLRAVLIGHSHGGVTVTSVTAALDGRYARRMFGVLIDRTTVLYDRPAAEMPWHTPLLNIYQLNEGWHGMPIEQPNVTNIDASEELAPIAPSDGGGPGPALVSHKTLDDAPAVQQRVEDAVIAWAEGG